MTTPLRLALALAVVLLGTSCAHTPDDGAEVALRSEWIASAQRTPLRHLDVPMKDQNGNARNLGALVDKPTLVTFFYTRCENDSKCSRTIGHLAGLQRQLEGAGLADKVRLLAITYEPHYDTPDRITRFAEARGLRFGENTLGIQLDERWQERVVDELQAPVSYSAGWVNAHGVEACLLDARGRVVRKYTTLLWENDQVTDDLKRVVDGH
jgi:protein SCO1/2